MSFRPASLTLLVLALAACGGGGGGGGVVNPPPTTKLGSITAQPGTIAVAAGSTSSIAASALDEAGAVISGATGFSFTSATPTIAEVSAAGSVLGISSGSTVVTVSLARDGVTKTATVNVTVTGTLPQSATVAASSTGTDFQPNRIAISAGGKVTFTFGQIPHNVTFDATTGAPSNIANSQNTTFDRVFGTAGNFAYQCTLHGGMNGSVIVR